VPWAKHFFRFQPLDQVLAPPFGSVAADLFLHRPFVGQQGVEFAFRDQLVRCFIPEAGEQALHVIFGLVVG
jgi:hypothetical protein